MTRLQQLFLGAVLAAGLAAAGWVSYQRVTCEQANSAIAVTVDYDDVKQVAALIGKPIQQILQQLRAVGISHAAITELTLSDLVESRRLLNVTSPSLFARQGGMPPHIRNRLRRQLGTKLPPLPPAEQQERPSYDYYSYLLRVAPQLGEVGVGYDEAAETARSAGLSIVARPQWKFAHGEDITASIEAARDIEAELVVFAGTQILGYQKQIEQTAHALQQCGLKFGYVELVPQVGERALARQLDYELIRTHSISEQEMQRITLQQAIDRFSLAVRERKVRLCYVHLFFNQGDPLESNLAYISQLVKTIEDDGFTIGSPQSYDSVTTPNWVLPVVFGAVAAGLIWLLQAIVGLSQLWFWIVTVAAIGAAAAAGLSGAALFRPLAGLAAALIFPTWAVLNVRIGKPTMRHPVLRGLLSFALVNSLTAAGGLLVAASLTDAAYLMNIQQFRGVKLAQLLPLLFIATVFAARTTRSHWEVRTETGETSSELPALRAGLAEALGYVVRYWHVVAALLGLGILAVLIVRSGNQPAVGASALEMQLRALLDRLLVVRPRSKEIFFAHPIMLLTLIWAASGLRRGIWVGLTAGAIGQVSLLNTFCHLHTPLIVSVIRVGHGVWLGAVAGLALWAMIYLLRIRPSGPGRETNSSGYT